MSLSKVLNTASNDNANALKVFYECQETGKIQLKTFSFNLNDFTLDHVRINDKLIKEFKKYKVQVLKEENSFRAEIINGDLHLYLNEISINVISKDPKFPLNRSISVSSSLTGYELKQFIQKLINRDDFKIIDERKFTIEGLNNLTEFGIKPHAELFIQFNENTIEALERQERQGTAQELNEFPFTNFQKVKKVAFDFKAPNYMRFDRGLNLLGRCQNLQCEAYDKIVCVQKGFEDKFNLSVEVVEALCPLTNCSMPITDVNNCIFFDCIYSIVGLKSNGETFTLPPQTAPKDTYETFESTFSTGTLVNWKYLNITTHEIQSKNVASSSCTIM